MTSDLLIDAQSVIAIAYSADGYASELAISRNHILTAQHRHLVPVLGQRLIDSLLRGKYNNLLQSYVLPALAEYVRLEASMDAYPPTPRDWARARALLWALSDHLSSNESQYNEYTAGDNVLNRCSISSGVVL